MRLVILHGPVASGKLTIGRIVARHAGLALFHNHLVVDAVAALFPFGSEPFRRLREQLWLALIGEAMEQGRDILFTFAPEPSVSPQFIPELIAMARDRGVALTTVALTLDHEEQERRLVADDRSAFGKLRDIDLLRSLRDEMTACASALPPADLVIDTSLITAEHAAMAIIGRIG